MDAPTSQSSYDIIFAGGGTTSCLIAGRLAKADPELKILVLEAGPHTKNSIDHIQPGRFIKHIAPQSKTTRVHVSNQSDALAGRKLFVHTAQCVGGGSAVNWLMYNRPSASDFDDWETEHGNPGWGSKAIIPLLQKAETYNVNSDLPTHGYSGPLNVSLGGHYDLSAQQFNILGPKVEVNRPYSEECNTMHADSLNVFARVPKWIDPKTGHRQDTAHCYIYNQPEHKNLEILDGCRVKRVIFENQRAIGVEFLNETRQDADPEVCIARASRLVVVSAGTFGSPAILERSGIGSASRLTKIGIPSIVDLPGVGENYQDHLLVGAAYFVDQSIDTLDGIMRGDPVETKSWLEMWNKDGSGLLGSNNVDAGIKLRPSKDELQELGPEFQERWSTYFATKPDKPILWMKGSPRLPATDLSAQLSLPPTKFVTGGYFPTYPECRGSIHITSEDVYAKLDFDCGFMEKASDIAIMRWAYKRSREIMRRLPVYRGAVPQSHPAFPQGSKAVTFDEALPVDISAPTIAYTAEDDAAIDDYHRRTVATAWHSLGTCAMKPREKGGVVDCNLDVYGVKALKVADVSIPPSNVSANTYSTAIAIGEMAAAIIARELNIRDV